MVRLTHPSLPRSNCINPGLDSHHNTYVGDIGPGLGLKVMDHWTQKVDKINEIS